MGEDGAARSVRIRGGMDVMVQPLGGLQPVRARVRVLLWAIAQRVRDGAAPLIRGGGDEGSGGAGGGGLCARELPRFGGDGPGGKPDHAWANGGVGGVRAGRIVGAAGCASVGGQLLSLLPPRHIGAADGDGLDVRCVRRVRDHRAVWGGSARSEAQHPAGDHVLGRHSGAVLRADRFRYARRSGAARRYGDLPVPRGRGGAGGAGGGTPVRARRRRAAAARRALRNDLRAERDAVLLFAGIVRDGARFQPARCVRADRPEAADSARGDSALRGGDRADGRRAADQGRCERDRHHLHDPLRDGQPVGSGPSLSEAEGEAGLSRSVQPRAAYPVQPLLDLPGRVSVSA